MSTIFGQDQAMNILQAAIKSGRVHHAWIFHGPVGVGKHTAAVEFAGILLDPDAGPNLAGVIEADPDCKTMSLIRSGNHPDLHLVSKELSAYSRDGQTRSRKQTNIPVGVIREFVLDPAHRSTHQKRVADNAVNQSGVSIAGKVIIIDEAELMDPISQNVMLKTLEEPPSGTFIILVTAREDRLLATIRSRCQRIGFSALSPEAMETWTNTRQDLFDSISETDRSWLLSFAHGSPGYAQLAQERGLLGWYGTLHPMLDSLNHGRFPVKLGATCAKLVDDYAKKWVQDHKNASKTAANKAGTRYMFNLLADDANRRLKNATDATTHGEMTDEQCTIAQIAIAQLKAINRAEDEIGSNANIGLMFDELIITWADCIAPQQTQLHVNESAPFGWFESKGL